MWLSICISWVCVLVLSVYAQNLSNKCTGITTTRYGPLKPPECGLSNVTLPRIVGGQPAKLGAWPWMTALGYESGNPEKPKWQCGGCLISEQHVLTAAHCLVQGLYLVRFGDLDLEDDNDGANPFQDYIDFQNIARHPDYDHNDPSYQNDIAILKTFKKVPFSSVLHPICLPVDFVHRNRMVLDGLHAIIAGWGRTSTGGPRSSWLLQTQVPITTQEKCKEAYQESVIDHRNLCAGQGGKDSCQYDSGGPLMIASANNQKVYYVIGITSWGYKCAEPTHPGVYTKVTAFLDYITQSLT